VDARLCEPALALHDVGAMRNLTIVVAFLGLALAVSCNQPLSKTDNQAPDGAGGSGGTGVAGDGNGGTAAGGSEAAGGIGGIGGIGGCQTALHYYAPGCGVAPRCVNGSGGDCAGLACGCSGKIIGGCANEFAEPYVYTIPISFDAGNQIGMTCDATLDAGH
jgi:hypothetical protein